MNIEEYRKAIVRLDSTARFNIVDGVIVWQSDEISKEDILENIEWHNARKAGYPPLEDQLDMIFHAGLGGDEFQSAIQAVKDAHPKRGN